MSKQYPLTVFLESPRCEKMEDKLACKANTYYKLHESRLNYGVDYGYPGFQG